MEAAWRHTDTLIFQSRYQEILLLVQDDPLEDLMRVSVRYTGDTGTREVHLFCGLRVVFNFSGVCSPCCRGGAAEHESRAGCFRWVPFRVVPRHALLGEGFCL